MNAEVVNLRQARKAKARSEKSAQAKQNQAKFGRTKVEKARDAKRVSDTVRDLEGKKLDD